MGAVTGISIADVSFDSPFQVCHAVVGMGWILALLRVLGLVVSPWIVCVGFFYPSCRAVVHESCVCVCAGVLVCVCVRVLAFFLALYNVGTTCTAQAGILPWFLTLLLFLVSEQ